MGRDNLQTNPSSLTPTQIAQVEGLAGKIDAVQAELMVIEGLLTSAPTSGKTIKTAAINLSASGTVVASVSSKRIKVFAIKLTVDANLTVYWKSNTTAIEGPQSYPATGGYCETVDPPNFILATTAGEALVLNVSGTGNVGGRVSYWDDDAS